MEEPRFNGLNIYGKEIPSRISTKAVWDEISDEESRLAFVNFSNQFVLSERKLIDPDFFLSNLYDLDDEILPLASRKNRIIEAQAGLSGMSFELYMQSSLLVKWHEHIRGNLTCVDIQRKRKEISYMSQVLKGVKEWEWSEAKPLKEFHSLVKWQLPELSPSWWLAQEYSLAKCYFLTFVEMNSIISRRNAYMNKLILEELAIDKKICNILEKQPPLDYLFNCRFCGRYSLVEQGKVPRHCGSETCEKKYQVERKNANRPQKKPEGWVPDFSGRPRLCSSCGEKRRVKGGVCWECLLGTLQGKA